MESVTVSRVLDAPVETVRDRVTAVGPFMRKAGFDEVTTDGSRFTIRNSVGLATIELECEVVDADCALAFEQREGIFETMETRYELEEVDAGTKITARTTFSLDLAIFGEILDSTVVKRKRRSELETQLDALEASIGGDEQDHPQSTGS